jgi:hypothetical protein
MGHSLCSEDVVGSGKDGIVNTVSAVEVEAEAITVSEQASSLTMSPYHLEADAGPAPGRNGSQNGLC